MLCFTHPSCLPQVACNPPLLRIVTHMLRCAAGNYDRTVANADCHIYNYERIVAQTKYHTSWLSGARATSICHDRCKSRTSSHSVWSLWCWQRPHYAASHKSHHTKRRPTRDLFRPCKQRRFASCRTNIRSNLRKQQSGVAASSDDLSSTGCSAACCPFAARN